MCQNDPRECSGSSQSSAMKPFSVEPELPGSKMVDVNKANHPGDRSRAE